MLPECRVGCYEQGVCVYFAADVVSQGKAEERGLGEMLDAEHSKPIFTSDQGCCHVVLTADPQKSAPHAQGHQDVAPSLPFPRSDLLK